MKVHTQSRYQHGKEASEPENSLLHHFYSNSLTPGRCFITQFSPDTNYPDLAQTPQAKSLVPKDRHCFRCQPCSLDVPEPLPVLLSQLQTGELPQPPSGLIIR